MPQKTNLTPLQPINKLIQLTPDSDLSALLRTGLELTEKEPKLLEKIDKDLDAYALEKKRKRMADKAWRDSCGTPLPGFDITSDDSWMDNINLGAGRPRMPATVVVLFIMIRGYLGGFKNKKTTMMILESKTLEICLTNLNYRIPGLSTIIENVNAVQPSTLQAFHDAQINLAAQEMLDDFKKITFDSTDVKANSAWPTDSSLMMKLADRAIHIIEKIGHRGLVVRIPENIRQTLNDIKETNKNIQLLSGKTKSNKKRAKLYRKIYRYAGKMLKELGTIRDDLQDKAAKLNILPSEKMLTERLVDWLDVDVQNLELTIHNSKRRINKGEKVPSEEKFYSLADEDASMIVKGGREPVLGYKPQLARSEGGLITAIIVPEGNASDSSQLEPIVEESMARTGVWPDMISFDDGYSNSKDREWYKKMDIDVSFSGAKGKKIIPKEEYDSEKYKSARNDRSAVESLMFTLKHNHDFENPSRCGIYSVQCELLEKVLAYNLFRIVELRKRKQKEAPHAA